MAFRFNKTATVLALHLCALLTAIHSEGYAVPQRTDDNVIVASYNIKWLGQTPHDLTKLAQVIQNFDICGIIEVKDEDTIGLLVDQLNATTQMRWDYAFGMRTKRIKGTYYEAFAVVWRTDRASLGRGIVSNISDPNGVYRNDPYLVSFYRGNFDFTLLLVHTRWDSDEEGTREGEVAELANQLSFLRGFLKEKDIIVAGDFNYSGTAGPVTRFAQNAACTQIDPNVPTTFKGDYSGYNESYDHIFISSADTKEFANESGVLDSTALVFGDTGRQSMKSSKEQLSDHLPVWAAFATSLPDDD